MALVSGNVICNLSGRLGNLSARTVNGQTILAARTSSFNASQEPASLEVRSKFAVTANFAKHILTLPSLVEIWKKSKESGISVFNAIFKSNFAYSSTEKPTEQNIITPGGFALPATAASVDSDKITASISALNTTAIFGADEVALSANALVVFSNPTVPTDPAFQVVALSKEVSNFNFTQNYSLQIDFNIVQANSAAKYQDSVLLLVVASKDAAGKVVQYSSTHSKTSAQQKGRLTIALLILITHTVLIFPVIYYTDICRYFIRIIFLVLTNSVVTIRYRYTPLAKFFESHATL
ncbi:MAG: hypothetical protein AB1394_07985 [Bacteroidota bacterium]